MKKYLYLVRHGQTLFNLQHKIQGWCDSPLTELGILQAEKARKYFTDNKIILDHAYSSTSERASDTLEIITDYKMPYQRLKGLKEWNFGAYEGKDECLNPSLPYGDFFAQFNGEKESEFHQRIVDIITRIMNQNDHNHVLVVTHGVAMAQFYREFEEDGKVKIKSRLKNCCILKYEVCDGKFVLLEINNEE